MPKTPLAHDFYASERIAFLLVRSQLSHLWNGNHTKCLICCIVNKIRKVGAFANCKACETDLLEYGTWSSGWYSEGTNATDREHGAGEGLGMFPRICLTKKPDALFPPKTSLCYNNSLSKWNLGDHCLSGLFNCCPGDWTNGSPVAPLLIWGLQSAEVF